MLSRKFVFWVALHLSCGLPLSAHAQDRPVTLFNNVRMFDGKSAALSAPSNVLVRGNLIERISQAPIPVDRRADTRIIDGGGRTLMPGLIDAHWHAMLASVTPVQAFGDVGYNNLVCRRRGDRHSDARLYHRSRRGRAGVRTQARHR